MGKREELIEKVRAQGLPLDYRCPLPVVNLEDFFIGNEDYGSIGCNLNEHPGPQAFYDLLRAVRGRSDVQAVLVEVQEVEEGEGGTWPFSDRVYILTTASASDVAGWLAGLHPDEVSEGYAPGPPPAAPALKPGHHVIAAWWD